MRWLEELSPTRFAVLVAAVAMVLIAFTGMVLSTRDPDPVVVPMTSGEPVETEVEP